ncbi:hypothetical protein Tco_0956244 [Tanacetum coccineum]|uniref:Zinc finger, CCHC-type n=1 Tax=Tanacetum coccineum TaxID=301880 RepID=A0ABQ5E9I6_9ASTR
MRNVDKAWELIESIHKTHPSLLTVKSIGIMLSRIAKFQSFDETLEAFDKLELKLSLRNPFGTEEFNLLLRAFCTQRPYKLLVAQTVDDWCCDKADAMRKLLDFEVEKKRQRIGYVGNRNQKTHKEEKRVILEAHDLWEAIEPKEGAEVDNKKDKATTTFLYQALTEDVILQVAGCETAKELWDSLKTRHVGEEKVQQARLQSLMIGFNTLQMKDEDTVDAFTAKLNSYATKARELGTNVGMNHFFTNTIRAKPDRFIQIVASIEQTSDLDDISLDEITGKLKAFEERIKLRKGGQVESQENLLFVHGEHSGKGRRFNKRGGHLNFDVSTDGIEESSGRNDQE